MTIVKGLTKVDDPLPIAKSAFKSIILKKVRRSFRLLYIRMCIMEIGAPKV